jgi:hypothetical protein
LKLETANRVEKLLALLLIQALKGSNQAEKAVQLNRAGFTAVEIADLLETNSGVIRQHLYTMRKKKK